MFIITLTLTESTQMYLQKHTGRKILFAQISYPCKVALCSPQLPGEKTSNAIIRIIIIPIHPLLTLLCVSGTHADLLSHTQTHHPLCGLSRITQ